jgi:triphosphoribosyl-dephospho-CoA synthase
VTQGRIRILLERTIRSALRAEVMALKPGNVHRYAGGHGMTAGQFLESAEAIAPILADPALSVGERILAAVTATRVRVGCNTNLGIVLLYAPLIRAFEMADDAAGLHDRLRTVLAGLDRTEAARAFKAICLAAPGGLGEAPRYDVHRPPEGTLLEAMAAAQHRDRIARQYVTCYDDIFGLGLKVFCEFLRRWGGVEWAAVACYLSFLTEFPDSHVERKFGEEVAREVQKKSAPVLGKFTTYSNPEEATPFLLVFDRELKKAGINPGTSADLTAACLLVHGLSELTADAGQRF